MTSPRWRRALGRRLRRRGPSAPAMTDRTYHDLYESHARRFAPHESIGAGDYDLVGRIELGALIAAGLAPDQTLVDFGCGTGRLAVHALPYLHSGAYHGIDISETMIEQGRAQVAAAERSGGTSRCRVSWAVQQGTAFELPAGSVDVVAAFSVFTHLEHEDSYRYLLDALRVVRSKGMFLFSCLTMDLDLAREVFATSASLAFDVRWRSVRNVTTSYEVMGALAEMAGWTIERWIPGDEPSIPVHGQPGTLLALGQSICVLRAP